MKRILAVALIVGAIGIFSTSGFAFNSRIGAMTYRGTDTDSKIINPFIDPVSGVGVLSVGVLRTNFFWGCFQPKPPTSESPFDSSCFQLDTIDELVGQGQHLSIVIRTEQGPKSWLDPPFWATGASEKDVSQPPVDLASDWNEQYGYSESYYNFIRPFLDQYKSAGFHSIVIENEANSDAQFVAQINAPDLTLAERAAEAMRQYTRMVATAKKAVVDLGLNLKVYDSGLQGWVLQWCVLNNYIRSGAAAKAVEYYRKMSGETLSSSEVAALVADKFNSNYQLLAVKFLVEDPSCGLYRSGIADALNFHFYDQPVLLKELVAYLRGQLPAGYPIVSNELGIRGLEEADSLATQKRAAKVMLQDYSLLLQLTDGMLAWFTPAGATGANDGAIIAPNAKGQNYIVPEMASQFKWIIDLFDGQIGSSSYASTPKEESLNFSFPDRKLTVQWLPTGTKDRVTKIDDKKGCTVYDSFGKPLIASSRITWTAEDPMVTVCTTGSR